ncbi:MAG: PilZ domain-containing protein, partial [Deltaproteobacteria bacterium]|nr:PilZ domain-containing protein [Deltaproteobacteria bacterium]
MRPDDRLFNKGMPVSLTFHNQRQLAVFSGLVGHDTFAVKMSHPIPASEISDPNEKWIITFILQDGLAYRFETQLKDKRITSLVFPLPELMPGQPVRRHIRYGVSYWTVLYNPNENGTEGRLAEIGNGTVVDLSLSGARIMTDMSSLRINQQVVLKIDFWDDDIDLGNKTDDLLYPVSAAVRYVDPAPYGCRYVGLEFLKQEPAFSQRLRQLIYKF